MGKKLFSIGSILVSFLLLASVVFAGVAQVTIDTNTGILGKEIINSDGSSIDSLSELADSFDSSSIQLEYLDSGKTITLTLIDGVYYFNSFSEYDGKWGLNIIRACFANDTDQGSLLAGEYPSGLHTYGYFNVSTGEIIEGPSYHSGTTIFLGQGEASESDPFVAYLNENNLFNTAIQVSSFDTAANNIWGGQRNGTVFVDLDFNSQTCPMAINSPNHGTGDLVEIINSYQNFLAFGTASTPGEVGFDVSTGTITGLINLTRPDPNYDASYYDNIYFTNSAEVIDQFDSAGYTFAGTLADTNCGPNGTVISADDGFGEYTYCTRGVAPNIRVTFYTTADTEAPIINVSTSTTTTSATLDVNANEYILIRYDTNTSKVFDEMSVSTQTDANTSKIITISGLSASTAYTYLLWGRDASGNDTNVLVSFTTASVPTNNDGPNTGRSNTRNPPADTNNDVIDTNTEEENPLEETPDNNTLTPNDNNTGTNDNNNQGNPSPITGDFGLGATDNNTPTGLFGLGDLFKNGSSLLPILILLLIIDLVLLAIVKTVKK